LSILVCTEEMQRHVRLGALDPAVVTRRDVEQVAGPEREGLAVVHDDAAPSRNDEPDVLDLTALGPRDGADVRGPLPPRVIAGAPDGEGPRAVRSSTSGSSSRDGEIGRASCRERV